MIIQQPERVRPVNNIEGDWVTLGGKQYYMPALNLRAMKEHAAKLDALQRGRAFDEPVTDEYIENVCTVVHAALKRNYPDISEEEVLDGVDMRNLGTLVIAVMGISGFIAKTDAAAPVEVNGQPAQEQNAGESTGTT